MASPRMKSEQSFDFGDSSIQDAMGSASESYSPPGTRFGLSPLDSSPPDGRRRRRDRPTWSQYTYTPYLDGHLWRKYGQKKIKDAEYPRLYYRCSYRDDRNCLASMLLQQQNSEVPPLYHVTYTYEHTCGAPPIRMPDIDVVVEQHQPPAARMEGLVLRFDSPLGRHHHEARQQHHAAITTPTNPYTTMSFGSSTSQQHPAAFRSDPGTGSSSTTSSSFPTEALPAPASSTNGDGDLYTVWNSFSYDFDRHTHFGDQRQFRYNSNNDEDDGYR